MWRVVCLLAALAAAHAESLSGIGQLIAAGRYQSALAALRSVPAPLSDSADWHLLASKAFDGINDPARAVDEAQKAIALDPKNEAAHLQLAQVFLTRHTPLPAYEILTDALTLFPDSVLIRLGLGLALQDLQRYHEAAAVLRECLRRKPDFGLAFEALGSVYLDANRYDELLAAAADYMQRNPADYRGYYYVAAARAAQGQDLPGAERILAQALSLNPDFAASYALLGKIRLKQNQPRDAIEPLQRAVRLRPDYSPAWLYLGTAYRRLGRHADAARAFAALRRLKEKEREPVSELQYHRGRASGPVPPQK